jgi:hypothetical protein
MSNTNEAYERQLKHDKLSGFLTTVDWQRKNDPGICNYDLIKAYLDNEDAMEKAWKEMAEYENKVYAYNQRILKAIKSVKGRRFYGHLKALLEDLTIDSHMSIVSEPVGKYQKETDFGRSITGLWIEQWSVGIEGDSYEGHMCVPIKPGKYLKLDYSC